LDGCADGGDGNSQDHGEQYKVAEEVITALSRQRVSTAPIAGNIYISIMI
jgi:hypothetical protein